MSNIIKYVFLFILFVQILIISSSAKEWNLDEITLQNLQKNNASEKEYEFAQKIIMDKKIPIGETQESINFINSALDKIFDIKGPVSLEKYSFLNKVLELGIYSEPEVKNILVGEHSYGFYYYVLDKNSKIKLEEISTYAKHNIIDTIITDKALNLIVKDNHLVQVEDIFENQTINRISLLNNYAEKRAEYDSTNSISDENLKEFLEYAKISPENNLVVNKALKEQDINSYNYVVYEIKKAKLKQREEELYRKEQAKKAEEQAKKEYRIKCFKSTKTHLNNFFMYDRRENCAFWIGMLNPINTTATIIFLPLYALLSPFSGLH